MTEPRSGVTCAVLHTDADGKTIPCPGYPHADGDVTVLGPEIFASKDGNVICWKGENYVRQQEQP
jgi:hypothetical protein